MSDKTVTLSVEFGTDPELVTVRHSRRSRPFVVGLLGVDKDKSNKIQKIYLRSKIHSNSDGVTYLGWQPSGAISTILTRIA